VISTNTPSIPPIDAKGALAAALLMRLHEMGRARAEEWLSDNFERIGVESTVDLQERYF
jgi:hypothetical protein